MASKKSKKTSLSSRKVTLSFSQAAVFVLAFGLIGVYAIIQSFAAPNAYTVSVNGPNPLHYNDTFTVSYTGKVTGSGTPWGYAECRANSSTQLGTPNQGTYTSGGVIWSGYRDLTGQSTGTSFELNDPIQGLWTGGGADCKLQLLSISNGGKKTVLATSAFTVLP